MQLEQDSSSVGQSLSKKQEVVKGSKLNQLQDEVARQVSRHSLADTVTTYKFKIRHCAVNNE